MAYGFLTQVVVPVALSLVSGVFLTLYAKPLTNWKESRDKSQALNKAAQFRQDEDRALSLVESPIEYLTFMVELSFNASLSLGSIIIGFLLITFPFLSISRVLAGINSCPTSSICSSPWPCLFLGEPSYIGLGLTILFKTARDGKRIVAAIKRMRIKYAKECLVPNPSLESGKGEVLDK